jgi:hypothetical protein
MRKAKTTIVTDASQGVFTKPFTQYTQADFRRPVSTSIDGFVDVTHELGVYLDFDPAREAR